PSRPPPLPYTTLFRSFDFSVAVLPITVAALATAPWIARHLDVPPGVDRVVLPGLCQGDLEPVRARAGTTVERGPGDLRDLPEFRSEEHTSELQSPDHL